MTISRAKLLDYFFRAVPDGVLAFDRDCRYTLWNPQMESLTNMTAAETVGHVAWDIFPFLLGIGEDERFHLTLAGHMTAAEDRPFDVPSGRSGWFAASYSPLRDFRGNVIGGFAIVRDVTARHLDSTTVDTTPDKTPLSVLSPNERFVFDALAEGIAREEIAASLNMSTRSLARIRAVVDEKLGIHPTPNPYAAYLDD